MEAKMHVQVFVHVPSATNVSHTRECFEKAAKQVKEGGFIKIKSILNGSQVVKISNRFTSKRFFKLMLKHKCTIKFLKQVSLKSDFCLKMALLKEIDLE